MRKIVAIPLLFIYLFAVTGVIISAHFCGTELASWNVYTENEGCTDGDCGDESALKHTCCDDRLIAAQVSYDQNHEQYFQLCSPDLIDGYIAPLFTHVGNEILAPLQVKEVYHANAPPGLWQSIPLFKLHSKFTYYG